MILRAMVDERQTDDIEQGLKAAIAAYYDNYTDAVELDDKMWKAIHVICENTYEYDLDADEIMFAAESEYRSLTGRPVHTVDDPNADYDDEG